MRITDPKQIKALLNRKTFSGKTVEEILAETAQKKKPTQTDKEFQKAKRAVQQGYDTELVLKFFKEHNLPEATPEFRFHPVRRWRFDFAFCNEKVALEIEGGVFSGGRHTRPKGFLQDILKYNTAAGLGWKVIRTTPQELLSEETINLLKEVLK